MFINDGTDQGRKAQGAPPVRPAQEATRGLLQFDRPLTVATAADVRQCLDELPLPDGQDIAFDLSRVTEFDTTGALILHQAQLELEALGRSVTTIGADPDLLALVADARAQFAPCDMRRDRGNPYVSRIADIGEATVETVRNFGSFLAFLGLVLLRLLRLIIQPRRMRWTSLSHHIENTGLKALPIIGLMSFLVGLVVVQQGAYQLSRFGAESFVVNMLGLLTLRELGVLMTAIMVAGRSGSAFTAQIGAMNLSEEVDAMRTIGIDPVDALVLPRMLALVLVMPLLVFYANSMAIAGGMVFGWVALDMSPGAFLEALRDAVAMTDFWAGMMKAPVFGLAIAVVGCFEGMCVKNDAESVGRHTTASVVQSIFYVIAIDAFFAVFFTIVGI